MSNNDSKNKPNNLVLLKSLTGNNDKTAELTAKEIELKNKLSNIENKLTSVKNIITLISEEKSDNLYNSEAFNTLLGSIAVTAAINILAEYFEIDINDVDRLLE